MNGGWWTDEICTPVLGHVVVVPSLPLHAHIHFVVIGRVASEIPILDESHEHRASFPPGVG